MLILVQGYSFRKTLSLFGIFILKFGFRTKLFKRTKKNLGTLLFFDETCEFFVLKVE